MHYPFGRRLTVAVASILLSSAGLASAAPMMSTSTLMPSSVMGDNDVLTAPVADVSTTSGTPNCASVPSTLTGLPAIQPDGCSMTPPRTPDPQPSFMWHWSLDDLISADTVGSSAWYRSVLPVSDMALATLTPDDGTTPAYGFLMAAHGADPSMNLSGWNDVFNVARIGVFQIPLRSDPAERTNILLSAEAVDGVTLQPGALFSFNDIVGERTIDKGYQDGWMFDQGKLIRGTGGGICLVATGLYNVALHAGLGLVERHPHSGLVRYADPGCDAAVVYGSEDLKFENTTGGPIVVRTLVEDDCVVVAFFGTPPPAGYQVLVRPKSLAWLPWHTVEKPDPTLQPGQMVVDQQPHSGYTVTLERVITLNGSVLSDETISSDTHRAVDKIVRVPGGDDMEQFLSTTLDIDA